MIPIEFDVEAWDGPVMVNCLGGEEEEVQEEPPFICCEMEEENRYKSDFYYFVKGRLGRLKR